MSVFAYHKGHAWFQAWKVLTVNFLLQLHCSLDKSFDTKRNQGWAATWTKIDANFICQVIDSCNQSTHLLDNVLYIIAFTGENVRSALWTCLYYTSMVPCLLFPSELTSSLENQRRTESTYTIGLAQSPRLITSLEGLDCIALLWVNKHTIYSPQARAKFKGRRYLNIRI